MNDAFGRHVADRDEKLKTEVQKLARFPQLRASSPAPTSNRGIGLGTARARR
jgi:hypothetical protein